MNSSLSAETNGPETPLNPAKSIDYYPGTEGDSELLHVQDTLLKSLRTLATSTRRRTSLLKNLLPEFDKAQERYSRHSKSHLRLPKGCTWTKIKAWMIETAGLDMSLRQLERELEELRNPGRKAAKKAAAAKRKLHKDALIKLAKGVVEAYRTGKDMSAAIEAFERALSEEDVPTDNLARVPGSAVAAEEAPEPEDAGKNSDIASAQLLESALAPVETADQFAPVSIVDTCATSSGGSTAVVVAETTVETDRAPREPAAAASEHQRNQAGGAPGDHGPDPSGIPGKPPRRSRPRSTRSKLAPAQMIPNLFDPGPDGNMGQTRQDGSPLPEADSSSARESGLVSCSIEPSLASPGLNPAAANRRATTMDLEDALRGDKHPTAALVTPAHGPSNFFATRCLNLFGAGVSDATSNRIVSGDTEAILEMLDKDRPQRYLVPYLLGSEVHSQVILDCLQAFSIAEQHTFILLAPRIDTLGTIQSGLSTRGRRWPRNLVVAICQSSIENMRERLQVFGSYRLEQKCVAFLPFESHPHPYMVSRYVPDLPEILKTCGRPWVVLGGKINRSTGKNSLSAVDAGFIVRAAKDAGCKVFCSSAAEMLALEAGSDSAQLLEAIRLDSLADLSAGGYFRRYREIPDFPQRPARNAGASVRAALPIEPDLGSQQLNI